MSSSSAFTTDTPSAPRSVNRLSTPSRRKPTGVVACAPRVSSIAESGWLSLGDPRRPPRRLGGKKEQPLPTSACATGEPAAFLGIDPSLTGTGLVALSESGDVLTHKLVQSKARGVLRLDYLNLEVKYFVEEVGASHAIAVTSMEGYSYGSTSNAHSIGEGGGAIKLALLHSLGVCSPGSRVILATPAQVKKFATGKANAEKGEIILACYKQWGHEWSSNDLADAHVLARMGWALWCSDLTPPEAPSHAYQAAVIDSLRTPKKKGKTEICQVFQTVTELV